MKPFSSPGKRSADSRLFWPEWRADAYRLRCSRPLHGTPEGIQAAAEQAHAADCMLAAYLAELVIEYPDCRVEHDAVRIPWPRIYEVCAGREHEHVSQLLALPVAIAARPILSCTGTLSDKAFTVTIVGWTAGDGRLSAERIEGAVLTVAGEHRLLPRDAWATKDAIDAFAARPEEARSQHGNELGWARIRQHADRAGAFYASRYLETTYVVTPETLRLPLTREDTPFGRVVTVHPTFEGAPAEWLKAFDGYHGVQPHYDFTRVGGRVRIMISEPVRQVLDVIKREMPGRHVAGSRAQRFIHNPWAFLGETAHQVIREGDFAQDRAGAGPVSTTFNLRPILDEGRVLGVDIHIAEQFADGRARTDVKPVREPAQLRQFVEMLDQALREECEWCAWDEYDLTLDAHSTAELDTARQLVSLWENQAPQQIALSDVYELTAYSERIEGIGAAKPIYVPVFRKPNESDEGGGWLPKDLTPMVAVELPGQGGKVVIPLSTEWLDNFERTVADAEREGAKDVADVKLPTRIDTRAARDLVDGFRRTFAAQGRIGLATPEQPRREAPREVLLVKTNFHVIDYAEARNACLALPPDAKPQLPKCLRGEVGLKQHQLYGIAWFQHLVGQSPRHCRGALLADDMGLGKTLQLLCVIARYYEQHPDSPPSLVLAPKTLVDNWENEVKRFFTGSFPEVLVLYGDALRERAQPLGLIDAELRQRGIANLLKPAWAGAAKFIITTYEVLTSYEFSLAKQQFAFVVCDEAQRIKTPGTFVTLAAKKLKAEFRIACTGTPVENSLADLWCLFDFVQPGLLGALEAFGKTYRRPIECETDGDREALRELQALIAPQTLRRTKRDIAADLPKKLFAIKPAAQHAMWFAAAPQPHERLEIAMSPHQRVMYMAGLKKMQDAAQQPDGKARARLSFSALHYMKAVCAEPYCTPGRRFMMDTAGYRTHLSNSPKLAWLLNELRCVQAAGEKAIVFTELREVQLALHYFIRESFKLKPFIINGDSDHRQHYIDAFSGTAGFDVIILSTLAAGAGLNITAANHVFHFTRAWNAAKESQATDRAYRIGQTRDVYVYCPTIVTDEFHTFELRLDELLKRKSSLADTTFDDRLGAMMNGTGADVSFTELVSGDVVGQALPVRQLTMDDIDRMSGFTFEVFCCVLWAKRGYVTGLTERQRGDGGVDVVATRGDQGQLLQCKCSVRGELGWDAIKEVTAGAARYQLRVPSTTFNKVAVTNRTFSVTAMEQARVNSVELVTRDQLTLFLASHPVSNHELDAAILEWDGGTRAAA